MQENSIGPLRSRLRSKPLSRPTSRHVLKSKSRRYGRAHCCQKQGQHVPGGRYWRQRLCVRLLWAMRTSGEGPIDSPLALPVVGGARSAHDERLVTRFPPAVWPFHPSIFDAPPSSHCDQQRPAQALPLLARLWASSACASAHLLVGMA